jgi:hypothetical protein
MRKRREAERIYEVMEAYSFPFGTGTNIIMGE